MERQKKFLYDCGFTVEVIERTVNRLRDNGLTGDISSDVLIDAIYEEIDNEGVTRDISNLALEDEINPYAAIGGVKPKIIKPKVPKLTVTIPPPTTEETLTQKEKLLRAIEAKKIELRAKIDALRFICHGCSQDATILFLPCGHIPSCDDCLMDYRRCPKPKCNKIVRGTKEIYFA